MEEAFQNQLLEWFDKNKRDLPFRLQKSPYRVWLSEVMAQQTTMSAVLPYYKKFIKRFPDTKSVATASESELLTYWQGLGYYSRIRNFQKACQWVEDHNHGQIPDNYESLLKLPGVGEYTAAAIASICFNEAKAVVDGNVKRVFARLFWYDQDSQTPQAKTFFKDKAYRLLSFKNPGAFNEALMELGAMICRPKSPACLLCPVQNFCKASKKNPEAVPVKKKPIFKEVTYHSLLVIHGKSLLLKKPTTENLIQNMWELPSVYNQDSPRQDWKKTLGVVLQKDNLRKLGHVKHGIMNQKITNWVYEPKNILLKNKPGYEFVAFDHLEDIPLNTLSKKIVKKFSQAFS